MATCSGFKIAKSESACPYATVSRKIPIYIVEDHDEVCIYARKLNFWEHVIEICVAMENTCQIYVLSPYF